MTLNEHFRNILLFVGFLCVGRVFVNQCRVCGCRSVNGAPETVSSSSADVHVGMVRDGSRCGIESMCIDGECLSLHHVMPVTCVTGHNGLVCSGHGVSLTVTHTHACMRHVP